MAALRLRLIVRAPSSLNENAITAKKARLARYLLHALERKKSGKASPEVVSNADETKVNLEHILPRDADPTNWPQFTAEQHADFFNRLGNLGLVDLELLRNAPPSSRAAAKEDRFPRKRG